ncbi:protein-disulfide reductase DsbD domain-containing protein [Marivita sp. GX14005]|uniref:protein-disulfide reductase DsbD domain-containing protein n=1 Tax=Marivita sp. GX14005 TaxID=2942276 RepID=UPI0020188221|nr:protein-disulfide reductase DsbD domain-containing protein [Marivita sp. GX14005]MCL3881481.1 hypothetical protein [Marivita sp. GX14005]
MKCFLSLILTALVFVAAHSALAETPGLAKAELRPGWRMADGSHMAALHLVLEPGWKTYWRAPGDVGIPPQFDWSGSRNVAQVSASWPTPDVFFEQEMRSVGYRRDVVIPLHLAAYEPGADMTIAGEMQFGLCKDICIPAHLAFEATLRGNRTVPDPTIAAALADMPYSAAEAGVREVTCRIAPAREGGVVLQTRIDMPETGGTEHVVIETGNPHVWVAEPDSRREGDVLHASTRMVHVEGGSFALDRSKLRFTVIGDRRTVDIQGCSR